jgi:ATP-dependent Lon protease
VLVDELDKASGDERYNPIGGLYQLLEKDTASRFCDQSVKDLTLDASHVSWILTANDLARVPAPILSRMVVFDVASPTPEQSMQIARRIYARERSANGWGRHFAEEMSESVVARLGNYPPRRMRTVLRQAFGRAAIAKRGEVLPCDIGQPEKEMAKPRIGFVH